MAKLAVKLRDQKRRRTVEKFKARRAALLEVIHDSRATDEAKDAARDKLQKLPRGLPVSAQRLRRRTGEASRGSFCSLSRAASLASSVARESWITSSRAARRALNFSTVLRRFWSRSLSASLAMPGSFSA